MFFVFFFLRIRLPPRSTRTDTLFPYTTLFRSDVAPAFLARPLEPDQGSVADEGERVGSRLHGVQIRSSPARRQPIIAWPFASWTRCARPQAPHAGRRRHDRHCRNGDARLRSEERRVGKECVRTFRSRWAPSH